MIKKLSILLTLVLIVGCLTSCNKHSPLESNPHNAGNEFSSYVKLDQENLKPEEYYSSVRQNESGIARYLETPYGMYFMSINFEYCIYYSEKGNTKYVKLCNRPDCNHKTEDCNAYTGGYYIGYYKDKIYYTSGNSINCMNMDGTNHMGLKTLYDYPDPNFGYFHNGYFYYLIIKGGTVGSPGNIDNNLYRVKIDDNSKPEIVLTDDIILDISMFVVVGDTIYLYILNSNTWGCYLYSYSTKTNTLKKITDYWFSIGAAYINENYGYCYRANEGIYKYNVATNEITLEKEIKFDNHGECVVKFLPDYIFLMHFTSEDRRVNYAKNQELYIYDWDYNLVDSLIFDKVPDGEYGGYLTYSDDYIIFSSDYHNEPDYYINKSEIGTGNLMFHKIED
ncbi:MAG: hypothetical protein PHY13_06575 [Clostridia bacterium]|nr:hypothetical protein [Clostridia bacterium]